MRNFIGLPAALVFGLSGCAELMHGHNTTPKAKTQEVVATPPPPTDVYRPPADTELEAQLDARLQAVLKELGVTHYEFAYELTRKGADNPIVALVLPQGTPRAATATCSAQGASPIFVYPFLSDVYHFCDGSTSSNVQRDKYIVQTGNIGITTTFMSCNSPYVPAPVRAAFC